MAGPSGDRRFYGRRRGPGLSPRQKALLERGYARIGIAKPEPQAGALDFDALFGRPYPRHALEIGFGKGEHLAWQAERNPDTAFIGCEPFVNGLASFLGQAEAQKLENVRVYGDDARDILEALPDGSLDLVYLLHPDPWPKRRHAKRRFIAPQNLDLISRVLRDEGEFRIATDHPVYRQWTAVHMAQRQDFEWLAERPADWRQPPVDWLETRYAAKAGREGRSGTYFRYRRLPRRI